MSNRVSYPNERMEGVVALIEPDSLRKAMSGVFGRLGESLDYLDLLEACVRADETLPRSQLLVELLAEKARALVTFIETEVQAAAGMWAGLRETLDSTTFALRHEIKRVSELRLPRDPEDPASYRAPLSRAEGILRNCLQQSVISLAVALDPSITGAELFGDLKLRHEQSILLLEALQILKAQVDAAESERGLDSYFTLIEGLKMFGQGYKSYLMYKDWAEFEQFSESVAASQAEAELWPLLHQFGRYLETLIQHVQMRSVLHNHALQQQALTHA